MNHPVDTSRLERLLEDARVARIQTHAGFVPAAGEPEGFDDRGDPLAKRGSYKKDTENNSYSQARWVGRMRLFRATNKLRESMYAIGREVALDPAYGAKTQINEGTFDKLFGDLGFELLRTPAAVEGFQEGRNSIPKV
jgi:hypothetical protein